MSSPRSLIVLKGGRAFGLLRVPHQERASLERCCLVEEVTRIRLSGTRAQKGPLLDGLQSDVFARKREQDKFKICRTGRFAHLIQGYCSGMTTIEGQDSGTIAPGAGPFTESCSWEIKPGYPLFVIGVRTWDTNAKFTLSVYDGMTSDTLLYSKTQGNSRPGEVRVLLHSFATVVFTAEAGTDSSTLEVYWYQSTLCNKKTSPLLTDHDGTITFGTGPYMRSMACTWHVLPKGIPDGYHVAFKVTMLDTAHDDAYVRITNAADELLARYSGANLPTEDIVCPTPMCEVYWHTGEVGNGNMHTGFALQYYLSDGPVTPVAPVGFPTFAIILIALGGFTVAALGGIWLCKFVQRRSR
ncbi:hypothetical protein PAPYR_5216 [Paratrimastix pyriformis]|uniref:CUB domain-containing protein n=1 Tax=Paratrimastix pyriformis TaxID=342808 RepID=A0ABQ8UI78_9EUKA|nr:hypothetical protein PAPYR_5216 [Paratrimastix pyriformis]